MIQGIERGDRQLLAQVRHSQAILDLRRKSPERCLDSRCCCVLLGWGLHGSLDVMVEGELSGGSSLGRSGRAEEGHPYYQSTTCQTQSVIFCRLCKGLRRLSRLSC